ncbi:MAG: hypothetical protein CSA75_05560 [Sorangium cellulosum]|nr:MAG: hypothetical protein CSA75_05560 [Sorangium cellulosum]
MRAPRSHRIIPIASCPILVAQLAESMSQLSDWLKGSRGKGEASLCVGRGSLPAISLSWQGDLPASVFSIAEQQVKKENWAGVSVLLQGASKPAVIGDPRGVASGFDGLPLLFPPGGFMQAFEEMNHQLVGHVSRVAEVNGRATLELFAGSGNFTIALAHDTDRLEAVEQQAAAVNAAQRNLAHRKLKARIRVGNADAPSISDTIRVVVLDPPRSGAPGAAQVLAASRVHRVVLVSCDPATLARDVAVLDARFELKRVDVFEMFPHTSHVETVVVMDRSKR